MVGWVVSPQTSSIRRRLNFTTMPCSTSQTPLLYTMFAARKFAYRDLTRALPKRTFCQQAKNESFSKEYVDTLKRAHAREIESMKWRAELVEKKHADKIKSMEWHIELADSLHASVFESVKSSRGDQFAMSKFLYFMMLAAGIEVGFFAHLVFLK